MAMSTYETSPIKMETARLTLLDGRIVHLSIEHGEALTRLMQENVELLEEISGLLVRAFADDPRSKTLYSADGKHLASHAYRRIKTHAGAATKGSWAIFARLDGALVGFAMMAPSENAFDASQALIKSGGPLIDDYLVQTDGKLPVISPKTLVNVELDELAADAWYLHGVGTDTSMRGTGLGRKMIRQLHGALDTASGSTATVFLHTTGAEHVFCQEGYEICCRYDAILPDAEGTTVPLHGMVRRGD